MSDSVVLCCDDDVSEGLVSLGPQESDWPALP